MPYSKARKPSRISGLPSHAQDIWVSAFNSAYEKHNGDEEIANKIAWGAVKNAGYSKDAKGHWIKACESFRYFNSLCLTEGGEPPSQIEIMRTGKWDHPLYGKFKITESTMDSIILNFNNKVRGVDIAFDLEHGDTDHKTEAVCWVKKLIKAGNRLLAEVDWTDFGKEKIKSKSFKYFSPEFRFEYEDNETGKKYNNVLLGGGLTNRPFIKNMNPIMLSETVTGFISEYDNELYSPCDIFEKEENTLNKKILEALKLSEGASEEAISKAVNELVEKTVKLAEAQTSLTALTGELKTLKDSNADLTVKLNEAMGTKSDTEKENIKLNERLKSIESKLVEAEWEAIYTVALSEGKIAPAMEPIFKAQFMSDPKATKEIISKLPVTIALKENGSSKDKNEEKSDMKIFEDRVNSIMLSEKIPYDQATIKVVKEDPELYEKVRFERRTDN